MFDLRQLFRRNWDGGPSSHADSVGPGTDGKSLAAEYERIILEQLTHGGIAEGAVSLEVRQVGRLQGSLPVFLGMLRLGEWKRKPAFRLMLGLPMLEDKVRRSVSGTWLEDVSRFGGLWLHTSASLRASPAFRELTAVIVHLEDADAFEEAPSP